MSKTAMVQQLARDGMSIDEIAQETGLTAETVYVYVSQDPDNTLIRRGDIRPKAVYMGSAAETELFRWQWTAVVNKLRIYAGLKPLAWPEITIPKPKETKAKAQKD